MPSREFRPIGDYGIVGDCRSAALIARDGSIDWLCWPRFDSPSLFASLLDADTGGSWTLHPEGSFQTTRRYLERTNVLETRFAAGTGVCVVTDCMSLSQDRHEATPGLPDHEILRRVECTQGEVTMISSLNPRPGYALDRVKMRRRGKLGIELELGRAEAWFRCTHECSLTDHGIEITIRLSAGECAWLSFSCSEESPAVLPPLGDAAEQRLEDTISRWRQWCETFEYEGPEAEMVLRSALVLKLLSYAPSGAIIAAPTTSLPERIGGSLNWDYRYCWLRDASLTVRALHGLGFRMEVEAFIGWLLNATLLTLPKVSVLYDVFGGNPRNETEARQFSGYRDSRPVRIQNAASHQLQLDVYGEVIDAISQYVFTGGDLDGVAQDSLHSMVNFVMENWDRPDAGIWEPRGRALEHTHSRLLCWVALDRMLDMHRRGKIKKLDNTSVARTRDKIRHEILKRGWNPQLESYTSILDGSTMDASLLLIAWYGFEHADSSRMRSTYKRVSAELRAGDGLLQRYRISPPEGAFGICSFWEAEYLALGGGTAEEAEKHFRRLLGYANDLGLFAEEIDPKSGAALGNFPQAFTHVGLISAAISLKQRLAGQKQLEHRPPAAA